MNIIWLSVAPWAPTGYGLVTREVVPRIQAEGHKVFVACKHFHTGTVNWNGIETIQGMDLDMLNRMIDRGEADFIFSLLDNHAIDGVPKKWISYTPFDTHHIPKSISRTLEHPIMIIALTRHGQKEIEKLGYECKYIPHGVDTKVYYPDEDKRKEGRETLGWEDKFIIGSVGVNYKDDRKNFVNLLLAFKWFHEKHDDARLYLSVNPLHTDRDDSLTQCVENLGIGSDDPSKTLIKWAFPDSYFMGRVSEKIMANRYRFMDVFCLPTKGEGFGLPLIEAQACGVPVITTGASTGPALCPTQYLIPVKDTEWEWFNKEWRPNVSAGSILEALEKAYYAYQGNALRDRGMRGCLDVKKYDWDTIHRIYWKPLLKEIEESRSKVNQIPNYNKIYKSFSGRITMSDCGRWCKNKCSDIFPFSHGERWVDRNIHSRSYPVVPDRDGRLWVDTNCPLHKWLSKRFRKEVKETWDYLWGFPMIRKCSQHNNIENHVPLDEMEIEFDDEYAWAMQSQYYTICPDLSKYMKGKVLEVGCGDGKRVRELRDKGIDAIGIDINPCRANGAVKVGDAEDIIAPDGFYDVVYSVDVLEHLNHPLKAVSEMFRCSRDLVINSITPVESPVFMEDPTHKVEWDRERWKREINEFGEIIDILEPFTIISKKRGK